MRVLILDDDKGRLRSFRQMLIGAVVVTTEHVADCIKELDENGPFDYFFCDHDLDGKTYVPPGPDTGYAVMQWLRSHPGKKPVKIYLHTCNEKAVPFMREEVPEATWLSAVFLLKFSVADLPRLEQIYLEAVVALSTKDTTQVINATDAIQTFHITSAGD